MLQDILPHVYHSEYRQFKPKDDDFMVFQQGRNVLLCEGDNGLSLPTVRRIRALCPEAVEQAFFLFAIDERNYFGSPVILPIDDSHGRAGQGAKADPTAVKQPRKADSALADQRSGSDGETADMPKLTWQSVMRLREIEHDYHSFGGAVGWQLANWYDLHRFCGRCGGRTVHSEKERAIICPKCGHAYYPRISPVVIIAILDHDRILLTRYNRSGYRRHALVAGFVEIGETLEDTVRREVMEEVGLKVKNIQYVESQPWPFSSSLIAGFRADVDGDPTVHLNTDGGEELAEAVWVNRNEIEIEDSSVSLTWDMIRQFRDGKM